MRGGKTYPLLLFFISVDETDGNRCHILNHQNNIVLSEDGLTAKLYFFFILYKLFNFQAIIFGAMETRTKIVETM